MSNTRIAAAATALVLGATGLAACNDSEDTTDAVTSEDPLSGSASTADPLAPTDDAVISEAPLSNEMLSEAPTN